MISIPEYRIVPSPTGIGWVLVERFDIVEGEYKPITNFRSEEEAARFIAPSPQRQHANPETIPD